MPCKTPNKSYPHECINEKACKKRGYKDVAGLDHVWPSEGHLIIERCEVFCWYCWEAKGTTHEWKFAWYLRRHVLDVHAGRTHPNMTCSEGWKDSETGNKKPWREGGTSPPMGRKALKGPEKPKAAKAPRAAKAAPTPKTPQQRRQAKQKKRATAAATSMYDTNSVFTTPSPPRLQSDSAFGMPHTQLSLPPGLELTPGSYGMTEVYDFAYKTDTTPGSIMGFASGGNATSAFDRSTTATFDNSMTAASDGNFPATFQDSKPAILDDPFHSMFDDTFAGLENAHDGVNTMSFGPPFGSVDLSMMAPNGTMNELGLDHNTTSTNSFSAAKTTTSTAPVLQPTWIWPPDYGSDTTITEPTVPTADTCNNLFGEIDNIIHTFVGNGDMSEGDALCALQRYTEKLQKGKS